MPKDCPYCGQPWPIERFGIRMSPLKARILDMVVRGGDNGVPTSDVYQFIFDGRDAQPDSLRTHVWQINEIIVDEGYRIEAVNNCYRLINLKLMEKGK